MLGLQVIKNEIKTQNLMAYERITRLRTQNRSKNDTIAKTFSILQLALVRNNKINPSLLH